MEECSALFWEMIRHFTVLIKILQKNTVLFRAFLPVFKQIITKHVFISKKRPFFTEKYVFLTNIVT